MSAETNARQSFSVKLAPWWDPQGESVRAEYPATIAEGMEWAGLSTWEPIGEPVYALNGISPEGTPIYGSLDGHQRITRSDNGAVTLGVVGSGYEPIPNVTPFELVAHMLDKRPLGDDGEVPPITEDTAIFADLGIRIETGGYLRDGQEVWVCGKLDDAIVLPGDFSTTDMFVVATMANDGTGALKGFSTMIRAVCKNTIKAGEMQAERDSSLYSFRHTSTWREKLEEAKKVIKGTLANRDRLAGIYAELDAVTVDENVTDDFIAELVPMPTTATDRSKTFINRDRAKIREMLNSPTTLPMADKALGLWLAAGQFFDHGRTYRTRDTYVRRTLIEPQVGKLIALDLLHDLTGAKVGPVYDAAQSDKVLVTVA